MEWHIWDFPDNIRIYFTDSFREKLYKKLKDVCKTRIEIARRLETNKETIKNGLSLGKRENRYKIYRESYISIKLLKKILTVFKHELNKKFLEELERNIVSYRAWNGWIVKNPKLPLIESPEFYNIVFHIIGDGNASKRHPPFYCNKSPELIQEFIKNLQIFGDIETHKIIREDGLIIIKFPKAITDILSHILNINFVRPTKLPKNIFHASLDCKIAAIRAFIDDEGHVSDIFVVVQKSRKLLREFNRLLSNFNIKTGKIKKDKNGVHRFYIWKESHKKFQKLIGLSHPKKSIALQDLIRN